jgi:hypothetical protein
MDTFHTVDFDKSVKKRRLVYKTSGFLVFGYIMCVFVALMAMCCITGPAIFKISNISQISIYYIIFFVVFDVWMIANIIFLKSLVRVEGIQKNLNRKDMIILLSHTFDLRNLDTSDENIIRDIRLNDIFDGNRVITCLLNDNAVYLNVTSLLRGDVFSPFSGVYNFWRCRRIINKLKLRQCVLYKDVTLLP